MKNLDGKLWHNRVTLGTRWRCLLSLESTFRRMYVVHVHENLIAHIQFLDL